MPEEAQLPLAIEARQRHHAAEAQLGRACADSFAAGIAGSARQRLEALVQGQYQIAVLQSEGGDYAVVQEKLVKGVAGLKTPRGRFGMHGGTSWQGWFRCADAEARIGLMTLYHMMCAMERKPFLRQFFEFLLQKYEISR